MDADVDADVDVVVDRRLETRHRGICRGILAGRAVQKAMADAGTAALLVDTFLSAAARAAHSSAWRSWGCRGRTMARDCESMVAGVCSWTSVSNELAAAAVVVVVVVDVVTLYGRMVIHQKNSLQKNRLPRIGGDCASYSAQLAEYCPVLAAQLPAVTARNTAVHADGRLLLPHFSTAERRSCAAVVAAAAQGKEQPQPRFP